MIPGLIPRRLSFVFLIPKFIGSTFRITRRDDPSIMISRVPHELPRRKFGRHATGNRVVVTINNHTTRPDSDSRDMSNIGSIRAQPLTMDFPGAIDKETGNGPPSPAGTSGPAVNILESPENTNFGFLGADPTAIHMCDPYVEDHTQYDSPQGIEQKDFRR